MKELDYKDQLIQQMLEQKQEIDETYSSDLSSSDIEAYQIVFDELDKKPLVRLPFKFSSRVLAEIQIRQAYEAKLKYRFLIPVFALCTYAVCYLALLYVNPKYAYELTQVIALHKWTIVFVGVVYTAIEYFDVRLLIGDSNN